MPSQTINIKHNGNDGIEYKLSSMIETQKKSKIIKLFYYIKNVILITITNKDNVNYVINVFRET